MLVAERPDMPAKSVEPKRMRCDLPLGWCWCAHGLITDSDGAVLPDGLERDSQNNRVECPARRLHDSSCGPPPQECRIPAEIFGLGRQNLVEINISGIADQNRCEGRARDIRFLCGVVYRVIGCQFTVFRQVKRRLRYRNGEEIDQVRTVYPSFPLQSEFDEFQALLLTPAQRPDLFSLQK